MVTTSAAGGALVGATVGGTLVAAGAAGWVGSGLVVAAGAGVQEAATPANVMVPAIFKNCLRLNFLLFAVLIISSPYRDIQIE
jgi:hypothetical protein